MVKTSSSTASDKVSPRALSLGALMLVGWALADANKGFEFHETWITIFWLVFSPLVGWIWVGWTMQCLRNLGLSRLLVLPILLPPIAFSVSLHKKWTILSLVALAVMLAAQLIIVIRKPARDLELANISDSDRPPT